jgi:branched-chain amino acid transport system substrate-binding protein
MRNGLVQGVFGAACGLLLFGAANAANADDSVIIGAATATSGWMAAYDEGPVAAARLAVDEINASGGLLGKHVVLQQIDTKTDRAQGARAGSELIGRGAAVLIESCDFDIGGPAALVANQAKVINFSPCGADIKLGNKAIGPYVFTMATDAEASGALVADWSYRKQHWKTAYILVDTIIEYNKSVCRGFEKKWTDLGGAASIVGKDSYKNEDASIAAQVTRLKSVTPTPDVIALCGVTPGFPAAIRQLRSAGVNTAIVGGVSMDGDAWHDALPKEQLTNVFYASYSSARGDDPRPEVQDFVAKYKATHNGEPPATGQAVTGHSVVTAWARAVQRAGTFASDPVLKQLEAFKDEPLLVGQTSYTPDLHTNFLRPMLIFGFTNGKASPFGYYDPRVGDYVTWWKK